MARDPLQVLLRLRGITLDQARRDLADRLREESAAAERCADIAAMIVREATAQMNQPPEGRTVESYAAWLGRTRIVQQQAQAASQACVAATAEAQLSLNEARAAKRVLEAEQEHARDVAQDAAMRREQQVLDEVATGRARPAQWSG